MQEKKANNEHTHMRDAYHTVTHESMKKTQPCQQQIKETN
jgi:hypothetical protein